MTNLTMGHGVSGCFGTNAFVKARPAISYTFQVPSSMGEEVAPIPDDHLALGYVLPEQPASPVATQTTSPQMAPGGSDSRRFYDRDGIHVYRGRRYEHAEVRLST